MLFLEAFTLSDKIPVTDWFILTDCPDLLMFKLVGIIK